MSQLVPRDDGSLEIEVDHKHQSREDLGESEDETSGLISGNAHESVPDSEPNIVGQSVQPSLASFQLVDHYV